MRKKLLLVNGSQVLMDVSKRILEREGYVVACAVGIDGAREQLGDITPDGIILANNLPDGSGLDLLLEIRTRTNIPVIFLSDDRDDEVSALNAGAVDFIKRPYNFEVLITRVEMTLNRAETTDANTRAAEQDIGSEDRKVENTGPDQMELDTQEGDENTRLVSKVQHFVTRFRWVAVACLALAIVIVGIVTLDGFFISSDEQGSQSVFTEGTPPLAEFPFITDSRTLPYTEAEHGITIPGINDIVIAAGSTLAPLPLYNSADNQYYFVFELILPNTMETLFKSGKVAPGMGIESITISRGMETGEHEAIIKIHTYSPADPTPTGSIIVEFIIKVE